MEELFSNTPGTSNYGSSHSETYTVPSFCDCSLTEEDELRSKIEEIAFQVLSQESFVKRLLSRFCVTEQDEHDDFISLTFPKKLWKIVESDKFKSVWWSEDGTSILINDELFKEEILGRNYPFKIFETNSMKSIVRQLNLYGFSKIQHRLQRSASLVDFLAEEKEASTLNQLLCYHNPNFKQGCPHLLARIKRRVRMKNVTPAAALLFSHLENQQYLGAEGNVNNPNSQLVAETHGESFLSSSRNLNASSKKQPSIRHMIASSADLARNDISLISSSVKPSEQITTPQHDNVHHLATFHMLSNNSYTQANGHILNFVTTSTCQYWVIPPLQDNNFGMMMGPAAIQSRYHPDSHQLLAAQNQWFSIPTIPNTFAASISNSIHQTSSYHHHPYNN
ncbi:heat shock transcription factor, Y-linked-like [Thomomys bottae]